MVAVTVAVMATAYEYPPNQRLVELIISLLPGELCVCHATENSEMTETWPFPSPYLLWRLRHPILLRV
jgi:hypothetical protein